MPLVIPGKLVYNSKLQMQQVYPDLVPPVRTTFFAERMYFMIKLQTPQGETSISDAVFTNITGNAATNCFGVKGMAFRSMTDGLVHLLRKEAMSKGVQVIYNEDGTVSIRLHIVVEHGINIAAACRSIMSEVQYKVSKYTGIPVKSVDVYVDSVVSNSKGV